MKKYTIKKGNHYASISIFERMFSFGWKVNEVPVKFRFSRECWWNPPRNADDHDLNKLCGVGYGLSVHSNSVRFAWAPDFSKSGIINVYGYTYDEKKEGEPHTSKFITAVAVDTECVGMIRKVTTNYSFTVGTTSIFMENSHPDPAVCNRLFPYFGGNNTAPINMDIELEYL
jgi:hypothetical protein